MFYLGQQAPVSNELVNNLNSMIDSNNFDDLTIKGIENKCKENAQHDDTGVTHEVLIALYCIRNDINKMKKHYQIAIGISDDLSRTNFNYAIALSASGRKFEAFKYFQDAVDLDPTNLSMLSQLIGECVLTGHFYQAKKLLEEWDSKSPNKPYASRHKIEQYYAFMSHHKLTDSNTSAMFKTFLDLSKWDYLNFNPVTAINVAQEECDEWLSVVMQIKDKSQDEVMDMNEALAHSFADDNAQQFLKFPLVLFYSVAE